MTSFIQNLDVPYSWKLQNMLNRVHRHEVRLNQSLYERIMVLEGGVIFLGSFYLRNFRNGKFLFQSKPLSLSLSPSYIVAGASPANISAIWPPFDLKTCPKIFVSSSPSLQCYTHFVHRISVQEEKSKRENPCFHTEIVTVVDDDSG